MGWLLLGMTTSPVVSMLLLSLVAAGAYSIAGPFWSLPSEFLTGYAAASGIAMIKPTEKYLLPSATRSVS